jgi:hypothetical protein
MNLLKLGFGIVGTGLIAGVVADALAKAINAQLIAVSSRRIDNAPNFVSKRQGVAAVQGVPALLTRTIGAATAKTFSGLSGMLNEIATQGFSSASPVPIQIQLGD